jgi:hypothetical protein
MEGKSAKPMILLCLHVGKSVKITHHSQRSTYSIPYTLKLQLFDITFFFSPSYCLIVSTVFSIDSLNLFIMC